MKKIIIIIINLFLGFFINADAQNVGVNKTSPQEALDVHGNVNLDSSLKINGNAGLAGQALMKNGANELEWLNPAFGTNYKFFETVSSPSAIFWDVPATVTEVLVEVWGAGGGGNKYAGGGGGSYVAALLTVPPGGKVPIQIGMGGTGLVNVGIDGGETKIKSPYDITAGGGKGASVSSSGTVTVVSPGNGGLASVPSSFYKFRATAGQRGNQAESSFNQVASSNFVEVVTGGNGGDAGNSFRTGGQGSYAIKKIPAFFAPAETGRIPGGGGGAGIFLESDVPGTNGSQGLIVFHY